MKTIFFLFLLLINLSSSFAYENHRLPFSARVNGCEVSFDVITIFLLSGEEISIKVQGNNFKLTSEGGAIREYKENEWHYTPDNKKEIGYLFLQNGRSRMKIQYILMIPLKCVKNGAINNYRIGSYPQKALRGNKLYNKPQGLIKVTKENKEMYLTPHFQLKQFLCKQQSAYPKYVVLREPLLYKLEYILEKVNISGYRTNTLYIMSGYRTPYYNKLIGNVKYSRHVYGDAADIFVDSDHDRKPDDLNGDGELNYSDVQVLAQIVEKMDSDKKYKAFIGGLGIYHKNRSHPGFIHVDVRGYIARW